MLCNGEAVAAVVPPHDLCKLDIPDRRARLGCRGRFVVGGSHGGNLYNLPPGELDMGGVLHEAAAPKSLPRDADTVDRVRLADLDRSAARPVEERRYKKVTSYADRAPDLVRTGHRVRLETSTTAPIPAKLTFTELVPYRSNDMWNC